MRYIFVFFLFIIFTVNGQQQPDMTSSIPFDPKVSKGVLENGLTYYVRANNQPRNRAEMMLVVKAGSVDEDDDQQGLAHFAEHMAFNGTKNFPKNELIRYFESIGMEFGPEINAYTSFDETVYMLKVPLDSALYPEKGLQVLYDWACQITDSDEEIEKERGVIREEWRGGRNANFRMQQQWLPVFLHNSKYAERLPIGKLEVIENFPAETLRRFRSDWYRPDLLAVIVVGDFDQGEMVQKVKDKFSGIPEVNSPREKEYFDIPDHSETLVSIVSDREAQYSLAYVFYKHQLEKASTLGDYRQSIIHSLYNIMINSRLGEKVQQADPPFIMAQSSFSELFGPKSVYQSVAVCHNDRVEEGLKAVLAENERVKKFGFTSAELERRKRSLLNHIEQLYNDRDKQQSISFAEEYKRNFLITEEPVPGIENEYEYYKTMLPGITLEEVNSLAGKWMTKNNRVVVINAPAMEGLELPDRDDILALLNEVEEIEITPYEDEVSGIPLLSEEPPGSPVIKERYLKKVDAVEWTMSNGATVVIKQTDFKEDEILFNAWSPGGNSLYDLDDDVSADFVTTTMLMSGISDFDKVTLDKMLADKVFSLTPYVSDLREGFGGNSSKKDFEVLLQMLYLYFSEPRFDEGSFQSFMNRMAGMLENKAASPEAAVEDTLAAVTVNYHERARPINPDLLKEANFERIKVIGRDRFRDAADFRFFIVGNINPDSIKPLVERYIGSIPASGRKEKWRDLGIDPPEGVVEKLVYKGQEEKSLQYLVFNGRFKYSSKNVLKLDALGRLLTTRLLEVIREDRSSVYSIGALPVSSKYPDEEYSVTVYYGTDPAKLEELKSAVFDEIRDFIENGPDDEELAKAKEKMLRERESAMNENGFWLNLLSNTYYLKSGNFSEFGTYETLVNKMTKKSVKKAFKKYFDFNNYISVALVPENMKKP
ncbi:MAG: insulinase family protein [Prolixibacteraceae bacterium]|nr:insulinase family protein [Prolixibacteraceae bacterium]